MSILPRSGSKMMATMVKTRVREGLVWSVALPACLAVVWAAWPGAWGELCGALSAVQPGAGGLDPHALMARTLDAFRANCRKELPPVPFVQSVCENTAANLTCGRGKYIEVTSALFGRLGGTDDATCPAGKLEACGNEAASLWSVQQKCHSLHQCIFTVNAALFGGDPCFGIGKYLSVGHICINHPPKRRPLVVCEGQEVSMNCGSEYINVTSALFGRLGGADDAVCPAGTLTACGNASASLSTMQQVCQSLHTCTFVLAAPIFGLDTCAGVGKYLTVDHACLQEPAARRPTLVCELDELTIDCGSEYINVTSALFGRLGGTDVAICPRGSLQPCGSATASLSTVQLHCQAKHSCKFAVTTELFGGDPCSGTGKYLAVEHNCTTSTQP